MTKKKNRQPGQKVKGTSCHHLCWCRRKWDKGAAHKLRNHPYCIVWVPDTTVHKKIHRTIDEVPVPSELGINEALAQLDYLAEHGAITTKDTAEKRLRVLVALFEHSDQPTADAFKKQLEIVREFNEPS